MTAPDRERHQDPATGSRAGQKNPAEMGEPYDLPDLEEQWPAGRPAYLIVVDQLRGWRPAQPPSLAELLETRSSRTREPEPDLEAEP